ncbi:MAG: nickel pincer cofactor biosynthesis protein LarC [Bacillota bacterium]|nr:nickel pincer cofactor biosynthesis protein LarC [Bacillota bacterium]
MKRVLYFDCFSGISGDMTLGALLDLGVEKENFLAEMAKLGLSSEFEITIEKTVRDGISGTDVHVKPTTEQQPARTLPDIEAVIDASALDSKVKALSKKIFYRLAEAEAAVHGIPVEDVHFHEVGAVDAIIDICGTAVLIDTFNVSEIIFSPINLGSGKVSCSHGELSVPVPATAELVKTLTAYQDGERELCTPTGAAIASVLNTGQGPLPAMTIGQTGYGFGKRETGRPNCLRVFLGELVQPHLQDTVVLLEANVDDMPPHAIGYAMEKLFEAGALDVWFEPIFMKKNRPAVKICALAQPDRSGTVADALITHTGTLGVRSVRMERRITERESITVETGYGPIRVKITPDGKRLMPEYEDCAKAAQESGATYMQVHMAAVEKAMEDFRKQR